MDHSCWSNHRARGREIGGTRSPFGFPLLAWREPDPKAFLLHCKMVVRFRWFHVRKTSIKQE